MKPTGSLARIEGRLLKALIIERARSDEFRSVSQVIKSHRSKSLKFDKLNRVLADWLKNNPNRTIGDFYSHCNQEGLIKI